MSLEKCRVSNERKTIKRMSGMALTWLLGGKVVFCPSALLGQSYVLIESGHICEFFIRPHWPSLATAFMTTKGMFPWAHLSLFLISFCFPDHPHHRAFSVSIPSPCDRSLIDPIRNNFLNVIKSPTNMQKL